MPNLTPATPRQLHDEGFPEELQTAFKKTADATQCVVLTRVPGGATTELIAAGHDLKGYFIKAKSCDWGPMSGFLCQIPAFNKKGVGGIKDNAKENLKYYDKFLNRLHAPQEGPSTKEDTHVAANAIKKIFENAKLKYPSKWGENQDLTSGHPITTTRDFLKDKTNEEAVAALYKPFQFLEKQPGRNAVAPDDADGFFTDDPGIINLVQKEDQKRFKSRLSIAVSDLRALVGDDSPFVPLKLKKDNPFIKEQRAHRTVVGGFICGIAYKTQETTETKRETVVVNYLAKKQAIYMSCIMGRFM